MSGKDYITLASEAAADKQGDECAETELFFKNAADWDKDWKTVSVEVKLISGANRIVLSTIGNGVMFIDELTVK